MSTFKDLPRPKPIIGYTIEDGRYRAKRAAVNHWVYGFLVKKTNGEIEGIINEKTLHYFNGEQSYAELAWIDENTLESYPEDLEAVYK